MSSDRDSEFAVRREKAKLEINRMDADVVHENPEREAFFEAVYENAGGDAAAVPWADLAAKHKLSDWLAANSDFGGSAIDVGCGLGDNAEALAEAGYETVAFDFSPKAIQWAEKRFPESKVSYQVADLFNLPKEWLGKFDLIHECYTLQSIPSETLVNSVPAIASLLATDGRLLVYTRVRPDGSSVEGPPWPLEEKTAMSFERFGLELASCERFTLDRPDKSIAHLFCEWRRPA
ncbi:MAG: class I SAM-dependent methyltransferase [Pseudomonadota bacterium]